MSSLPAVVWLQGQATPSIFESFLVPIILEAAWVWMRCPSNFVSIAQGLFQSPSRNQDKNSRCEFLP